MRMRITREIIRLCPVNTWKQKNHNTAIATNAEAKESTIFENKLYFPKSQAHTTPSHKSTAVFIPDLLKLHFMHNQVSTQLRNACPVDAGVQFELKGGKT